ncbi:hematopoietic SH2 domain-containing protein homolog [Betta splendens]|uniref:Hematopoietic SH2 domain-containing protein homolog n=1 Tax=Betta splendens TaxID=158456 RepID=A0A6P7MEG0_BETSP|nr:hematopoietic SH2 domain-containing protein homolog [Betta splendens]
MMEAHQPAGGQHDAFTWFAQSQAQCVIGNGVVPEWFHGVIPRKVSEELLLPKPPGYFLIRVSQSRVGYTLSYRAADSCRHFMIDVLGDGQYVIIGENRSHRCLQDLVDFHRRQPIKPYTEVLTVPCGQSSSDKNDYAELLFPKRAGQEHLPPALPHRPNTLSTSAPLPPGSQTHRLYPNLDVDFKDVTSHSPAKPVPKARKEHTVEDAQTHTPPEVPARNLGPLTQNQAFIRTASGPTANDAAPGASLLPTKTQDVKHSVISNLKNLKKKFQKNRSASQENTYTEISVEATSNVYQEIPRRHEDGDEEDEAHSYINTDVTVTDRALPPEYQPPPPFAPGY